jgi:hypothetical protein
MDGQARGPHQGNLCSEIARQAPIHPAQRRAIRIESTSGAKQVIDDWQENDSWKLKKAYAPAS